MPKSQLESRIIELETIIRGFGFDPKMSLESYVRIGDLIFPTDVPVTLHWEASWDTFRMDNDKYISEHADAMRERLDAWGIGYDPDSLSEFVEYGGLSPEDTSTGIQAKISKSWNGLDSFILSTDVDAIKLADHIILETPLGKCTYTLKCSTSDFRFEHNIVHWENRVKDPNISELSVKEVKECARSFTDDNHCSGNTVDFSEYTSISEAAAKELYECVVDNIKLNGLTDLSLGIAKILAEMEVLEISLTGLRELNIDVAKILSTFLCDLNLSGLTEISEEAINQLAEKGDLDLSGLTDLPIGIARELGKWEEYSLTLGGLTYLHPEVAIELARFKGGSLEIGLTQLDVEIARELAKYKGGSLVLNRLTEINIPAARELATLQKSALELTGLIELNGEEAKELATFKGDSLSLSGVTQEAIRELTKYKRSSLELILIDGLPLDTAKLLANWDGSYLLLRGITDLSEDVAKELAKWSGQELELSDLTDLSAETARGIATFKGDRLHLGLNQLNADTAKELAHFKGTDIYLHRLTDLSVEAGKELAMFKGETLCLPDLSTVSNDLKNEMRIRGKDSDTNLGGLHIEDDFQRW